MRWVGRLVVDRHVVIVIVFFGSRGFSIQSDVRLVGVNLGVMVGVMPGLLVVRKGTEGDMLTLKKFVGPNVSSLRSETDTVGTTSIKVVDFLADSGIWSGILWSQARSLLAPNVHAKDERFQGEGLVDVTANGSVDGENDIIDSFFDANSVVLITLTKASPSGDH